MIANVIDHRKQPHRWKSVNVVMENTWQDNGCDDSGQAFRESEHQVTYDDRKKVSIAEAMAWGMAEKAEVTLYIYDHGDGI
jgi:hypothetical protein